MFIIHQLGKPAATEYVASDVVRVGRDPNCDLVLKNVSVSRRHALIRRGSGASYSIEPLADGNPVIVDGRQILHETAIDEGSEIQLGRFFLVFSKEREPPEGYLSGKGFKHKVRCDACAHEQEVSALLESPTCELCGGPGLTRIGDPDAPGSGDAGDRRVASASGGIQEMATFALDSRDLISYHDRLRHVSKAAIVRLDASGRPGRRHLLAQDASCTFGKAGRATLSVAGFVLGTPAEVAWDRERFVVRKTGLLPAVRLNGEKVKEAPLKSGDEIRIGGSAFRFVLD